LLSIGLTAGFIRFLCIVSALAKDVACVFLALWQNLSRVFTLVWGKNCCEHLRAERHSAVYTIPFLRIFGNG
jgi:hypothetical protein